MTVEFRTVNADELGLSTNTYTTSTTHSCAVNHDGIEADISRNVVFLSQQAAELHHDGRADGKALIDLFTLDDFLHADSHDALLAVRTVVSHDDDLITCGANLILKNDEFFASACNHADNAVASSLESLNDGQHRSRSYTSTCAKHGAVVLDMSCTTKRSNHICNVITFVQSTELTCAGTNRLDYKRDGSLIFIASGYRQRHSLALLINANNDEVACFASLCNQRSFNVQAENFLAELNFLYNLEHSLSCFQSVMFSQLSRNPCRERALWELGCHSPFGCSPRWKPRCEAERGLSR